MEMDTKKAPFGFEGRFLFSDVNIYIRPAIAANPLCVACNKY